MSAGDSNAKNVRVINHSVSTSKILKLEGQNSLLQYFEWDLPTTGYGFDVYYHFAAKLYDSNPGTIIVKLIYQGYIDIHLKDVVQRTPDIEAPFVII